MSLVVILGVEVMLSSIESTWMESGSCRPGRILRRRGAATPTMASTSATAWSCVRRPIATPAFRTSGGSDYGFIFHGSAGTGHWPPRIGISARAGSAACPLSARREPISRAAQQLRTLATGASADAVAASRSTPGDNCPACVRGRCKLRSHRVCRWCWGPCGDRRPRNAGGLMPSKSTRAHALCHPAPLQS